MNTYVHLYYLGQFFLELEIFETKFVQKTTKTHISCSIIVFAKIVPYMR